MSLDWYIVIAVSGYENKVAKSIRDEADKKGLGEAFADIIVPTESYAEVRRGKRVESQRRILPGYVLVRMDMSEGAWGLVTRIPHVARFLGPDNKPAKISEREIERVLKRVEEGKLVKEEKIAYEVQEVVRIKEGAFEGFTGVIEGVDEVRGRLKVLVSILGREAPVELEFGQVEKVV